MNRKAFLIVISTILLSFQVKAQTVMDLYTVVPNAKPNSVKEVSDSTSVRGKVTGVTRPTLTIFMPEKQKAGSAAIIICPGGGYAYLVMNHEGYDVARALAAKGIVACVLKYRLPNPQTMADRSTGPLQDAQQAIRLVRAHAKQWNVDTGRVGIMGFSAGGHLAATASTHYRNLLVDNPDHISVRPSFSVLIYPVISFQEGVLHKGSKKALIGEDAAEAETRKFSNELQVTADTPPAFLVHCSDDKVVPVTNSINYYSALHNNNVAAELHVYTAGGHGFGLNNPKTNDRWLDRFFNWMITNKFL